MHTLTSGQQGKVFTSAWLLLLLAAFVLVLTGCAHRATTCVPGWKAGDFLTVSFPRVQLAKDEYIESIEFSIEGAVLAMINWIPPDWSVESHWDSPERTLVTFQAGHFPSGLTNASALDGFITVQAGHPTRFELKAVLVCETPHPDVPTSKTNVFDQSQVILRQVPRPFNLSASHVLPAELLQPYVAPSPRVSQSDKYIVQRGDTFASIASRHGLSVSELKNLNSLNTTIIRVGQILRVR